MQFGVRDGLLDIYHSESEAKRKSQHNLRVDYATRLNSLPVVKNELQKEIENRRHWLKSQQSSPHSGAQMQADIDKLEAELAQYKLLTAAPSVHLPRGMIARVSLRLLGGTAANHVSHVMCRYPECREISSLAALKSEHAPSG